ncbi:MAG: PorV/PorQ family protein [bacterium]
MQRLAVFITLLLAASDAFARPGSTWLEVGPGARAAALAEAVVASPDGPSGAWWNPAGAGADGGGIELMHANWWVDGTTAQHIATTFLTGKVGWGVSVHHVGVSNLEFRDGPSSTPIDYFDARDFALGATVSAPLYREIRAGFSIRYLSEDIYTYHSNGWSLDAGLLWPDAVSRALDLGAAVRHLGNVEGSGGTSSDLPTTVSAGIRLRLPLQMETPLALLVEIAKVSDLDPSVRIGAELRLLGAMDLRAGWRNGYEGQSLSAGFGLTWRHWGLDFGYSPFVDDLGNTQRFSLRAAW